MRDQSAAISGINVALAMLVHELDARSLVSKDALAGKIEDAIHEAVGLGADVERRAARADIIVLRNLAELLRWPRPQARCSQSGEHEGEGGGE
jgi:hypothetical protein